MHSIAKKINNDETENIIFKKSVLMEADSGENFDNSVGYDHDLLESKYFIEGYFKDSELQGKTILDAGCRTGYNTKICADKGALLATGIDLSRKCVEKASIKYTDVKNARFLYGNIMDLNEFADESFDVLVCVGTIFYLSHDNMKVAMNEFKRVVKKGGTILVSFQKEKGLMTRAVKTFANLVPLPLFLILAEVMSWMMGPLMKGLIGRNVSRDYIKYDILISLRDLHFGHPFTIDQKYRIDTVETEFSSEKTTATYKINNR